MILIQDDQWQWYWPQSWTNITAWDSGQWWSSSPGHGTTHSWSLAPASPSCVTMKALPVLSAWACCQNTKYFCCHTSGPHTWPSYNSEDVSTKKIFLSIHHLNSSQQYFQLYFCGWKRKKINRLNQQQTIWVSLSLYCESLYFINSQHSQSNLTSNIVSLVIITNPPNIHWFIPPLPQFICH